MKRWYVLQVYPGYEERVKKDIQSLITKEAAEDLFGQILVPRARIKPLFDAPAERGFEEQQLFPGYVLIEMEANVQAMSIAVASPRALKFLGGQTPEPLSESEINHVFSLIKGDVTLAKEQEEFIQGQEVEIKEGPFSGFVGIIDKVDKHNDRLVVMVSIFGRMTPVELGFNQVK